MSNHVTSRFKEMMVNWMKEGMFSVPALFLKTYRQMNLTDADAMLILQLQLFQEHENNMFPTITELGARLSATPDEMMRSIQRLMKDGYIRIENKEDENGIRSEAYNLTPLFDKLTSIWIDQSIEKARLNSMDWVEKLDNASLFTIFEREMGRPLSPMECESLTQWVDKDGYSEPLIRAALKEAVFAGKLSFRYIDRILLEWEKNNIKTPEAAKEYSMRFRGHGQKRTSAITEARPKAKAPFYNWLEEKE